jgi:predicted nucleic acid-binding protein
MSTAFLDTNILIYAALQSDPRSEAARALLARGGVVGVQGLNEFVAVARRKLRRPWPEIHQALAAIRACCPPPRPLTLATHEAALGLAERYGFQVYDALIVAAALEAGCGTLFSEDMQDGQVVAGQQGRVTIRNPFAAA